MLRVTGPDANTYLQGQFTQDLRRAETGPVYGLWLDQKGRVLADSHVLRLAANDYLVVAFGTPAATLRARLEAYLIADEVELHDESAAWNCVLVWGEEAGTVTPPAHALAFPSRRAAPNAREFLVPSTPAGLGRLVQGVQAGREQAELARLRAGLPAVPADIGPRDLPAEGALDDVAISYTKGCYLGQEVVARLKSLGQVRRALHLVTGPGAPPVPGTALFQAGRRAGEVRSGAAEGGNFIAMAMLTLLNLDPAVPLGLTPDGAGIGILRRV